MKKTLFLLALVGSLAVALSDLQAQLWLYTSDGPVVLDENPQQFVKVDYRYNKDGRLIGAAGKGNFKIDDGFGNISQGIIQQAYIIIGGQAKLTKNDTDMDTKYLDGAKSKQNLTVQYNYDKDGKLQSATGGGKYVSNDSFGSKTESKISQTFFLLKDQAKLKSSKQESETKNVDGSWKKQDVTTTYTYDSKGKMTGASGSGTSTSDDGFGNVTTSKIAQKYPISKGKFKWVGGIKPPVKTLMSPPKITSSGGVSLPGGVVRFFGPNLDTVTSVIFPNNKPARFEVSEGATKQADKALNVTIPEGAKLGFVYVIVSNPAGSAKAQATVLAGEFRVTRFQPAQGVAGEKVTIFGSGFEDIRSVAFNGELASFKVRSATEIEATVPEDAATGSLTVSKKTDGRSAPEHFVIPPQPDIQFLKPTRGSCGTSLALEGENFIGVQSVTMGGQETSFEVKGQSKIVLTVPDNVNNGDIVVKTAKNGIGRSLVPFQVILEPEITGVSRSAARSGSSVRIDGHCFGKAPAVKFGEQQASTYFSGKSLMAVVPDNPGSYPVTVTTFHGTAQWKEGTFTIVARKPQPSSQAIAKQKEIKPAGSRSRRYQSDPASTNRLPTPPPPPEMSKRSPQPQAEPEEKWTAPPVEEAKTPPEPVEEEVAQNCPRGTWSPTLKRCIEEETPEEVAPPDCPGGTHWSPTLKSCQPD